MNRRKFSYLPIGTLVAVDYWPGVRLRVTGHGFDEEDGQPVYELGTFGEDGEGYFEDSHVFARGIQWTYVRALADVEEADEIDVYDRLIGTLIRYRDHNRSNSADRSGRSPMHPVPADLVRDTEEFLKQIGQ